MRWVLTVAVCGALGFCASLAEAGRVVAIESARTVLVDLSDAGAAVGSIVAFRQVDEKVHGWGVVSAFVDPSAGSVHRRARVSIRLHSQNELIVVGDEAILVDPSGEDSRWPGRSDLLLRGKDYSSRYKPLVYAGVLFDSGPALAAGEFVLDPLLSVQYGITDWLTIETVPLLYALSVPNLGARVRVIDNEFVVLTASVRALLNAKDPGDSGLLVGGLMSLPSNTKFVSHLEVRALVFDGKLAADEADTDEVASAPQRTQITSRTEYIFDSWDRLLLGPSYDFDLGTLGGFCGYLMVFDHLHVGVSVHTNDFFTPRLSVTRGYYPWLTLFWRL